MRVSLFEERLGGLEGHLSEASPYSRLNNPNESHATRPEGTQIGSARTLDKCDRRVRTDPVTIS
jgi:hypothetical protein